MSSKRLYPETTLFLNLSVDGCITSHDSDDFDPDKTWKQTPGIRGLLQQFYDFSSPHMVALTTGPLMKSVGVNIRQGKPHQEPISLVVLDPDADLTPAGISYLSQNVTHLYIACLARSKPDVENVTCITYPHEIDLNDLFQKLYQQHHVNKLLIHSIAPLNAALLDAGLISYLNLVISPILVGGHGTPALPNSPLLTLRPLELLTTKTLPHGFLSLRYRVLN